MTPTPSMIPSIAQGSTSSGAFNIVAICLAAAALIVAALTFYLSVWRPAIVRIIEVEEMQSKVKVDPLKGELAQGGGMMPNEVQIEIHGILMNLGAHAGFVTAMLVDHFEETPADKPIFKETLPFNVLEGPARVLQPGASRETTPGGALHLSVDSHKELLARLEMPRQLRVRLVYRYLRRSVQPWRRDLVKKERKVWFPVSLDELIGVVRGPGG